VKIQSVELRQLSIPLLTPFETSGWREEEKTCILIEMRSGDETGFGECAVSPGPWYGPETMTSAWHILSDYLIPTVLGKEFTLPNHLLNAVSTVRGNNMARAGLEMAFYDLASRVEGRSLNQFLGGTRSKIESGVSVGIQASPRKLVEVTSNYLEQGYKRIKLKIKPGNDQEQIATVREHFPEILLTADANGAYGPSDYQVLLGLDSYRLLMLEQPFAWDDLVEHANLQRAMRTPICLDESVAGINDLKSALSLKSCRILNIKPARVGGLTISKEIHNLCATHNIPVWCGGLLETGVGRAHNVALASLPGFAMPNDISASNRYFKQDIVTPEFRLNRDGTITVPTGPGLGVTVDRDILEMYTVTRKRFIE
jgi:O-succinylbenzoate synthase